MAPALSAYLDLLRLAASLTVFVHHAHYDRFGGGWLASLGGFGHEAVVVFFVLSGFVIAYVVDQKERNPRDYVVARFSRLWSVAVPAILATIVMDGVGVWLAPTVYGPGIAGTDGLEVGASLLFVNEWWFSTLHVGSNGPYWSLSYEAAYYLLFGIMSFARRPWPLLLAAAALIGPKILLLLPAWYMGVLAYRRLPVPRPTWQNLALALAGGGLALTLALGRFGNIYVTWRWREWLGTEWFEAFSHGAYFVSDNAMAAGVALHLVGMAGLLARVRIRQALGRVIARASAATFPIYLLHYPALYFFSAVSMAATGALHGPLIALLSLLTGVLFTPVGEWLRRWLRRQGARGIPAA